ncbi:MAG: YidB family protein [Desulfobacterales bacterium]|jgi:uncharacterized protein YidB (DUF937 family)
MDTMDLLKIGAQFFIESNKSGDAGSGLDMGDLTSALSGLTGGSVSKDFDLGSMLSKMDSGGLGAIAQSWLGDGTNDSISPSQVTDMLGTDKISEFASKLGLSNEEAAGGLSDAIPQIVDKASSGGSLLDSFGGVSGAIGLASKLFGK